jgi:hypothetical protein
LRRATIKIAYGSSLVILGPANPNAGKWSPHLISPKRLAKDNIQNIKKITTISSKISLDSLEKEKKMERALLVFVLLVGIASFVFGAARVGAWLGDSSRAVYHGTTTLAGEAFEHATSEGDAGH